GGGGGGGGGEGGGGGGGGGGGVGRGPRPGDPAGSRLARGRPVGQPGDHQRQGDSPSAARAGRWCRRRRDGASLQAPGQRERGRGRGRGAAARPRRTVRRRGTARGVRGRRHHRGDGIADDRGAPRGPRRPGGGDCGGRTGVQWR